MSMGKHVSFAVIIASFCGKNKSGFLGFFDVPVMGHSPDPSPVMGAAVAGMPPQIFPCVQGVR